jgi:hypothetical protein
MRVWCLPGCCLGLLSAQAPCSTTRLGPSPRVRLRERERRGQPCLRSPSDSPIACANRQGRPRLFEPSLLGGESGKLRLPEERSKQSSDCGRCPGDSQNISDPGERKPSLTKHPPAQSTLLPTVLPSGNGFAESARSGKYDARPSSASNSCGSSVSGGYSPTTDTAQSSPQRPIQACFDMTVPISLIRQALLLRRLRVPQVDVQTLDLFDQQENRLSGRAKLRIAARKKTRAPGAELLDLALVQTFAQRSVHQGHGSVRRL